MGLSGSTYNATVLASTVKIFICQSTLQVNAVILSCRSDPEQNKRELQSEKKNRFPNESPQINYHPKTLANRKICMSAGIHYSW